MRIPLLLYILPTLIWKIYLPGELQVLPNSGRLHDALPWHIRGALRSWFALQITRSPGKVFELRRGLPKCPQELQEAKPC